MGQSQSNNLEQSRMSVPKINQLQFWKQVQDIRYGDIKVYKLNNGHVVAVKDHNFQDDEQWHLFRQQAEQQMQSRQKDLFLIEMMDLQYFTEKELCTQMTQAHSVYEYFDEYLERLIVEQAASKQHFEEIEIAAMLHCTLITIQNMSTQKKSHGDIRPLTISVTSFVKNSPYRQNEPFPVYKLTDIQQLTEYNAFKRCVTKQQGNYNLSPEQMQFLKQKVLLPTYDLNKSDVFSIGLTALQMAILKNINNIYDYTHNIINTEKLDTYIREMKTLYSEQMCSIVCQLLQLAPETRPNSRQANDLLIGYRFQLEDYFREYLPNYSIDFRQQNNNIKIEQQVVSRVVDTTDVYEQLELLEQRAKIALLRSQDAQNKCQKTPSKQLDQTRSCQLYNNLTPITQKELQLQLSDYKQDNLNQQSYQIHNQHQQMYQPKEEINNFQIQDHEQYQYNQQDVEDKSKQSVVEQMTPSNLKNLQPNPINYNRTQFSQQQLFESINTDEAKLYQQQQYSQQYQNQSKYQQQPRQSQLLRDQELTKQLTGQQEIAQNYLIQQENHLQSPYSSKQEINQRSSQQFDSQQQVNVRLSGTQAQRIQRQLTGSMVDANKSIHQ